MRTTKPTSDYIKENVLPRPPLSVWWLVAALAATAAALGAVALIDLALPEPLTRDTAPPDRFIAEIAHEHLVNLTSIGPRVAGSYENEVLGVGVVVAAVKAIARAASPHNRVELDVTTASGAFPLTFFDGMNNVYRGVASVAARVSGAGGRGRARALLLNCHIDTVPDSPGASDDGAGCAVLLETLRALAAAPAPLRHDVVFLFNGAEENIMQASHGFITQHRWAAAVRAFINIEACGAGGREVLFQAGPHDPWIMEVYAGAVPHPFASSLAQELFESGLVPADTDFRIFRDFGKLSGVDLAWSSNGYVYHTRLDTAARVPAAALQRTGDNVLALVRGMLSSEQLGSEVERDSRQPVFFDVLGVAVVCARAPAALAAAAAALALLAADLAATARHASRHLYVSRAAWLRAVARADGAQLAALGAGAAGAAAAAGALHAAGARLAFFSRPWLLAPLYALPALSCAWAALLWLQPSSPLLRGWWGARAAHNAGCALAGAALLVCCILGLRSGFLPLLWAALPASADLAYTHVVGGGGSGGARAAWWAGGALGAVLQTWYLALGSLRMFVPIAGRAGVGPVPTDVVMAVAVAGLALGACSWLLPLVLAARHVPTLIYAMLAVSGATWLLVALTPLGAPYGAATPQRLMVFHVRRTVHARGAAAPAAPEHLYWVPALDANSPHSVDMYAPELRGAEPVSAAECARWVYCGAPYYLPVLSLIAASHRAPAPRAALPVLAHTVAVRALNDTVQELCVDMLGPSHIVLIVSPAEGARVAWSSVLDAPLESPRWGRRRLYFFALHQARSQEPWHVCLHIQHSFTSPPERWADLSIAGHALFGSQKLHPEHKRLLDALPQWTAPTGWGVDLHLHTV